MGTDNYYYYNGATENLRYILKYMKKSTNKSDIN